MNINKLLLFIAACFLSVPIMATDFVKVNGMQFYRNGRPYYYIGTNFWYAPILGSEGTGGNRTRLCEELDELKALGIDNLRVLVGADAGSSNANTVKPYLQPAPGELNDTLLAGLDFLLMEMGKRDMVGVFYLTNSWDWSGGYGFYLKQTGHEDSPNASGEGYNAYVKYASQFVFDKAAQQLYYDYVRQIVSRTNSYTGVKYIDDPAIMAWQICNEPRPFSAEGKSAFSCWILQTARLIKELDPNHLVSTGSEGLYGCEVDKELYEQIHTDLNIDYLTIHVWPINWGWSSPDRLLTALPNVYLKSGEYIDWHEHVAQKANKPLVIEEFGYSRNRTFYLPGSSTSGRDAFYQFVFDRVIASVRNNGVIAGCNFWGWGGKGRPASKEWKPGNDYLCDPPHEPQGWYSVYDTDSTTNKIISETVKAIARD